jgi:hypothetical protein
MVARKNETNMYYKEEWIRGKLYCKASPNGEWVEFTNNQYAERLLKAESELKKLQLGDAIGSMPSDDRIVAEAIRAARKDDTEVGLLPRNKDIKMFCLGAKWMRDWVQCNDR